MLPIQRGIKRLKPRSGDFYLRKKTNMRNLTFGNVDFGWGAGDVEIHVAHDGRRRLQFVRE